MVKSATAKLLITENNAKRQREHNDQKISTSDNWIYVNMIRWVVLHVVPNIRLGLCLENAQLSL
jgi:hypothetical protein